LLKLATAVDLGSFLVGFSLFLFVDLGILVAEVLLEFADISPLCLYFLQSAFALSSLLVQFVVFFFPDVLRYHSLHSSELVNGLS